MDYLSDVAVPDVPDLPDDPVITQDAQIIIVSPDGTMTVYNSDGELNSEAVDTAYSIWVSQYGVLDKPFNTYSVSEGLLLVIAVAAVAYLFGRLFKRRKF